MASLDTNCLARWLLRDVPEQADRVQTLLLGNQKYDVADVALVELVFVLSKLYKLPRDLVADSLRTVISNANIKSSKELFDRALELYEKYPAQSFTDCYLAVCAELNGATPLLTFDRKLANQLPEAQLLQV